jgi:hypothetical protein
MGEGEAFLSRRVISRHFPKEIAEVMNVGGKIFVEILKVFEGRKGGFEGFEVQERFSFDCCELSASFQCV